MICRWPILTRSKHRCGGARKSDAATKRPFKPLTTDRHISMLEDKVRKWLEATGFPLEMAAANAFRSAGFQVRQSVIYIDPETDKGREIDIIAFDPDLIGAIGISFVLECKSSSKPWVVFTSQYAWEAFSRTHMFAVMSERARKCLANRILDVEIQRHIERPSNGGYGIRQALTDSGDAAYTAACGAIKAAASIAHAPKNEELKTASFAFPVIVVDAPIFECSLNDDGTLNTHEVNQSEFLFGMATPRSIATCIKIITKDRLPEFAKWARGLANRLRADLKNEEKSILESFGG